MPPKQRICLFIGIVLLAFLLPGRVGASTATLNSAYKACSAGTGSVVKNVSRDPVIPPRLIVTRPTGTISSDVGSVSVFPNLEKIIVSGDHLTSNILITTPIGFEISTETLSGFTESLTLIPDAAGIVNNTAIYIRSSLSTFANIGVDRLTLKSGGINTSVYIDRAHNQTVVNGEQTTPVNFVINDYTWLNDKPGIGIPAKGTGNITPFNAINDGATPVVATIRAVSPTYAYVSSSSENLVRVIDLTDNTVKATIPVGNSPTKVITDVYTNRVFVNNVNSGTISVINTVNNAVIATINVGGTLGDMTYSAAYNRLFVSAITSDLKNTLVTIETSTNSVIATKEIAVAHVAVQPGVSSVFIEEAGKNYISIFNIFSNAIIGIINTGAEGGETAFFNDRMYVINPQQNTISVISLSGADITSSSVTNTIPLPFAQSANAIAVSQDGTRLYITNTANNSVRIISTVDFNLIANIPLPAMPVGIQANNYGDKVYVVSNLGSLSTIDVETSSLITTVGSYGQAALVGNSFLLDTPSDWVPYKFTITINPSPPQIVATGILTAMNTTFGTASSAGTFNVKGINVGGSILITPPTGFELSLDGINFSPTVTVGALGNVPVTPVYIRLGASTPADVYYGDITLTSTNTPTATLPLINSVVSRSPITLTAAGLSKTFGDAVSGVASSAAFSFSGAGLKNGNTITGVKINYGNGASAASPSGIYTGTVVPSDAEGGNGFVSTNYDITYVPGDITVSAASLTIAARNKSKTYGATLTGVANVTDFDITAGTLLNGNTLSAVTIAYGAGAASNSPLGTYAGSVVPSLAVGYNGFLSSNYNITYLPGNITVDVAKLTITPNNQSKINGLTLTNTIGFTNFTTTGLQNNETIGSVSLTYGTGAAALDPVGTYVGSIVPSAPVGGTFDASNYNIVFNNADITVTPAPPPFITVTGNISAITATYGAVNSSAYKFDVSGTFMLAGITVTPPTGYEVSLDNNNFSNVVTVGVAGVIINATPVYVRLSPTAGAGTYTGNIVLTSTDANTVNIATDVSVVDGAPLKIATANVVKVYGQTLPTQTGSANFTVVSGGLKNGNVVTSVGINYGPGAAAADGVRDYTGSVTPSLAIGANGFLTSNYNITYVPASISVTPAPVTVTANKVTKTYGVTLTNGSGATEFAATGLQNNETIGTVTINYRSGADAAYVPGTYNLSGEPSLATGGTFAGGNYQITYLNGDIEIAPARLTITAKNASKVYGDVLTNGSTSTDFDILGLQNGETADNVRINYVTGSNANVAAGQYIGAIVPSALAGGTVRATNYSIAYVPGNLVVNAAPLIVKANNVTKIYGSAFSGGVSPTGFTITGLKNADAVGSVTLSMGLGAPATSAVGNYNGSIVASGAAGNTFTPGNYNINYLPGDIKVTAASLTIKADAVNKVYGQILTGGAGSSAFTTTGLQNGENIGGITITYGNGAAGNAAVARYSNTVTPSFATGGNLNAANYQISYIANDIVVSRAPLAVNPINKNKIYGQVLSNASSTTGFTATGLQNGENVASIILTYGAGAAANAPVGVYSSSVTSSSATGTNFVPSNYNIIYGAANVVVNKAQLLVAAKNKNKVYGTTLNSGSGSVDFTATGLQNAETITAVTVTYNAGAIATAAVSKYTGAIIPSVAVGGNFSSSNYNITYSAGDVIVGGALLTITANNVHKAYKQAITGGAGSTAFTTTPLPNGETINSVTVTYSAGSASLDPVNDYTGSVVASAAVGAGFDPINYIITYISGTLTVDPPPAPLIIAAGTTRALRTQYGDPSLSNTFTVSGTNMTDGILISLPTGFEVSTDNISFSSSTTIGSEGNIPGFKIYVRLAGKTSAGNYSGNITLSSHGALNVTLAQVGIVDRAPLTIAANDVSKIYGDALIVSPASTAFITTGLKNSEMISTVTINYNDGATATAAVGKYSQSVVPGPAAGTGGFDRDNYDIKYVPGNVEVTPALISITAKTFKKDYGIILNSGPSSNGFTLTSGTLKNSEVIRSVNINYALGASAADAEATYEAMATASDAMGTNGFLSTNYTITYISGNIEVAPVLLLVTADNKTKDFGAVNPVLTVSYNGFVNGETEAVLTALPAISTDATTRSPLGSYKITLAGAAAVNYVLKYITGTLTIGGGQIVLGIPNTFTPNNDGINDTWVIKNLEAYPNTAVDVFNRAGQKIFSSIGYGQSWDGSYRGATLPPGVYYYIINPKSPNVKVMAGSVTVIK